MGTAGFLSFVNFVIFLKVVNICTLGDRKSLVEGMGWVLGWRRLVIEDYSITLWALVPCFYLSSGLLEVSVICEFRDFDYLLVTTPKWFIAKIVC